MVKKYLKPSEVGTEKGHHTSMWITSNEHSDILLSKGKRNLFCLGKGQTTQSLLQQFCKEGKIWPRDWSLTLNGCSNLECYRKDKFWWELELETLRERLFLRQIGILQQVQAIKNLAHSNFFPANMVLYKTIRRKKDKATRFWLCNGANRQKIKGKKKAHIEHLWGLIFLRRKRRSRDDANI